MVNEEYSFKEFTKDLTDPKEKRKAWSNLITDHLNKLIEDDSKILTLCTEYEDDIKQVIHIRYFPRGNCWSVSITSEFDIPVDEDGFTETNQVAHIPGPEFSKVGLTGIRLGKEEVYNMYIGIRSVSSIICDTALW